MTSVQAGSLQIANQYDILGRPVSSVHTVDGAAYTFSTQYGYPFADLSGPGSVAIESTFPADDSPETVGERVATTYDKSGGLLAIT